MIASQNSNVLSSQNSSILLSTEVENAKTNKKQSCGDIISVSSYLISVVLYYATAEDNYLACIMVGLQFTGLMYVKEVARIMIDSILCPLVSEVA